MEILMNLTTPFRRKLSNCTDQELVTALRNGDNDAFEALYHRYFVSLSKYAYKKLQDECVVEELVQDVFVDLWKKRTTLEVDGQIAGLLFAMLRNKALHGLRARLIQFKHLEAFSLLHKNEMSEELTDVLYARQVQEKMNAAINQLSPQCRLAFTLSRYENLSYKQIAREMDISVNTVEKHIGKALHFLRQEFKEYNLSILIILGIIEMLQK
jgi:RNA polymerase sigma-70 factor (ECF subfamily)